ncbi:hypothetical protein OAG36_00540 [bacterium]|nr:hypothetical protein [bacterium]
MAKGNEILISNDPRGRIVDGTVEAAIKPGTCVQIDTSQTALNANGRLAYTTYEPGQDGNKVLVAVLLEDMGKGKLATEAYVSGDQCRVYYPLPGDELNMVISDISGTADDHSFGELLMIDNGTGELVASSASPEEEPFQLLETITDPTADTLAHCIFTGV